MRALELRNLRKVYRGQIEALKGIDLEVEEGEFFALLGPNGAGKSTTISIIASLVKKTSGTVKIFGYDLDRQWIQAKRCLGLVPQEINFNQFERVYSIVVNQAGYYGIPRRKAHERAEEVLRTLGLWEKRDQVSRYLSGGMKRRLMIARALVHRPRLLILDEPTAGVDLEVRYSMWQLLKELNREGTTIILTTHYLEEAERLCERVAIIDRGQIVECCSLEKLLDRICEMPFRLDLRTPLKRPPRLPGYRLEILDPTTLVVVVPTALGLNRLFEALAKQGIKVLSISPERGRLEQLFFERVQKKAA